MKKIIFIIALLIATKPMLAQVYAGLGIGYAQKDNCVLGNIYLKTDINNLSISLTQQNAINNIVYNTYSASIGYKFMNITPYIGYGYVCRTFNLPVPASEQAEAALPKITINGQTLGASDFSNMTEQKTENKWVPNFGVQYSINLKADALLITDLNYTNNVPSFTVGILYHLKKKK